MEWGVCSGNGVYGYTALEVIMEEEREWSVRELIEGVEFDLDEELEEEEE